jgi:hypothetical protein
MDPSPTSANEINDELTAKSGAASVLVTAGFDPHDVLEVVGLPDMKFIGPPGQIASGLPGAAPAGRPSITGPAPRPASVGPVPGEPYPDNSYVMNDDELEAAMSTLLGGLETKKVEESKEFSDVLLEMLRGSNGSNGHRRKELV